ncbi:tRNA lysidine(34) synthetase TilS [Bacillus seohaeanensis]|jgi:tRNA(Ile)-lysidine synthase|uniref:tRNA(Ile)-lysidine synthase n=1 Tax=Bacillus seohaeanensis TaxID=284580 RepID=A0ABW5RSB0_9BACI
MFEQNVKEFINKHDLICPGDVIVTAVSGGPDSIALLHFLHDYREVLGITVIAAHLDHMFRGEESYQELLFVQEFCRKHDIPFYGERINVAEEMKTIKERGQEAARHFRYKFLKEVMEKTSATKLAFGHHGDDQVETILMRLTRGSGGVTRAGIPVKRQFASGEIIRPFLSVNKEMIEEYCRSKSLEPRRDPSNEKTNYTRNRFRKTVVPFLKEENPAVHEQFQRFSEELKQDETLLEELTRQSLNKVWNNTFSFLHINGFLTMPLPLQRRSIHLILNYLYKAKPSSLSSVHIYDVLGILKGKSPNISLDLPEGLKVTRSYDKCYFHFDDLPDVSSDYCYRLLVNREVEIPDGSQFVLKEKIGYEKDAELDYLFVNPNKVTLPLAVRTRKPGDKIKLKGLNGTKKLKNLFIDEKIPLHERNSWPIVVDADENVLWVPGIRKSNYDMEESEHYSLVLQFKRNPFLGGSKKC